MVTVFKKIILLMCLTFGFQVLWKNACFSDATFCSDAPASVTCSAVNQQFCPFSDTCTSDVTDAGQCNKPDAAFTGGTYEKVHRCVHSDPFQIQ